ncbi:MAG: hypothetical protein OEU54_03525 [Gemmatimonadota bacterium]|nr:hypothetical protein [Gemmatimonadota bacterium]
MSGRPPVVERLHPLQVEAYRRMTSEERIEAAFATTEMLREMLTAQARGAHPEWTEEQVRSAVAARFRGHAG